MRYLFLIFLVLGCNKQDLSPPDQGMSDEGYQSPRGGVIVVLGSEELHIEFVHQELSGDLTGYILGSDAKSDKRLKQEEIELKIEIKGESFNLPLYAQGNVMSGEKVGDSAEFTGQDDRLKGVKNFKVQLKSLKA